jgi:hypothetical protein
MTGSNRDDLNVNTVGNLVKVTGSIARIPVSSTGDTDTDQCQAIQTTEIDSRSQSGYAQTAQASDNAENC